MRIGHRTPSLGGTLSKSSRCDALVLFGATGDLARKMILPALYRMAASGRLDVPVVGVGLSDMDTDAFRRYAHRSVQAVIGDVDDSVMSEMAGRLSLVTGDYRDPLPSRISPRRSAMRSAQRTTWQFRHRSLPLWYGHLRRSASIATRESSWRSPSDGISRPPEG